MMPSLAQYVEVARCTDSWRHPKEGETQRKLIPRDSNLQAQGPGSCSGHSSLIIKTCTTEGSFLIRVTPIKPVSGHDKSNLSSRTFNFHLVELCRKGSMQKQSRKVHEISVLKISAQNWMTYRPNRSAKNLQYCKYLSRFCRQGTGRLKYGVVQRK